MSKSSSCLVYLMYLCLLAAVHTFDLQKFCLKRCAIGQGGNLCRCTAHHFAGKRSDTHAAAEAAAAAAAAANLDVEGQSRRSHMGNNNNNEEDKMRISGAEVGPEDFQVLSMNDDPLSNSQVLYPLMGIVPAGSRRASLMGRLPADEENMELLQGESGRIDSSSSDKDNSRSSLNILAKRYRRYNQQLAGGVPPSYKRISAASSPDNTAQLKDALEKALDNKANQRILKLLLSKVSR